MAAEYSSLQYFAMVTELRFCREPGALQVGGAGIKIEICLQ